MEVIVEVTMDKIHLKIVRTPKSYFIGLAIILSEDHKDLSDTKYLSL